MKGYNKAHVKFAYTALLPIFVIFLILRCWPILEAFRLSFTNHSIVSPKFSFVGFQNYINLFSSDRDFRISLINTMSFVTLTTITVLFLALSITLVMYQRKIKNIGLLQSFFFLPVVVSVVPSAMIWKWMYDPQYGIFNYVLSFFGISSIGWLVDKNYSMYSIILFVVWKRLGYFMVIFWVGLKGISRCYIEAAKIDGASNWQITRSIILPLLKPIMFFSLVVATIQGFTIFSEIYVMTVGSQSAPGNIVKVLAYDIYERAFLFYKTGQANAEAVILFLIVLGLTVIWGKLVRKGELY